MISAWSPERIAELTALIADDLPYEEIGRRMGLNKNIVLGKAHRLGYGEPTKPQSTTIRRLDALDVFPKFGHCAFPIGDPGSPSFHFCAASVGDDPARPYCHEHSRRTFTKPALLTDEEKVARHAKMAAMRAAKGAR